MIKAIFFDLDGTLLDTIEDIGDAMNRVLKNHGYPIHEVSRYKNFVGNGMPNTVKRALPQNESLGEEDVQLIIQEMKLVFADHWKIKSKLFPGIREVLTKLEQEGYLLGILSNKPHEFAVTTCEYFLNNWDFKVVQGYDPEVYPRKPDPTALLSLMKKWDLKKEEVLYVGDSDVDIKVAINAGVTSVGVSWGFRGVKELKESGADFVVDRPEEILELARSFNQSIDS